MPQLNYVIYAVIFAAGIVIGRLSMAVQYALMKKHGRRQS